MALEGTDDAAGASCYFGAELVPACFQVSRLGRELGTPRSGPWILDGALSVSP